MGVIEFIAAVAWPVAILGIAILYRRPVARLVAGERTNLRAGPFELAWEKARPTVPRPSPILTTRSAQTSPPAGHLASALVGLAREAPADAILAAYDRLGEAFRRGLREVGIEPGAENRDALSLARQAQESGVTGPEITDAVHGLNVLRNLTEHGPPREVSEGRAHEYLAMADAVLYSIAMALSKYRAPARAGRTAAQSTD